MRYDRRGRYPDDSPLRTSHEVWVRSWGEILDAGERKLRFFQEQLNYEATDDCVTQHLRESYSHFIPDALAQPQSQAEKTNQSCSSSTSPMGSPCSPAATLSRLMPRWPKRRCELAEETGIDPRQVSLVSLTPAYVEYGRVPARPQKGEPEHYHLDIGYAFTTLRGDVGRIQESEVTGTGWYPLDAAERPVGRRITRAVGVPAQAD